LLRVTAWVLAGAGCDPPPPRARRLGGDELARARDIITPYLDTGRYPDAFACLYGDVAARELGYRPLGLPRRVGFAVALADARGGRVGAVGHEQTRYRAAGDSHLWNSR